MCGAFPKSEKTGFGKMYIYPKPKMILGGRKTMKKVLSVALASAMVLGMGVSSFAISYNSGSNNEADWPENF